MKIIVTKFYSILIDFKNYKKPKDNKNYSIIRKYFKDVRKIDDFSDFLVNYLSIDNVKYNVN